jgi:hypothetical protein
MREINSYFKDRLRDWFREHTGSAPADISIERSHRDRYHTNIRVEMPTELRKITPRKYLVMPIKDAMIDGIINNVFPPEILNTCLTGALKKAGFFHPSHFMPQKDEFLY